MTKKTTAKKVTAVEAARTISEGVAASWKKKDVREKRGQRSAVEVDGIEYASVRKAFAALGLPDKVHIAFRGKLKKAGELKEFGKNFKIIPLNYEEDYYSK